MKFDLIKSLSVFFVILIFRLCKGFGIPNADPILAGVLPFAKQGGKVAGFLLAACSIVAFDALSGTLGVTTVIRMLTYGAIGIAAGAWFQNRALSLGQRNGFSVCSILVYDMITGPVSDAILGYRTFVDSLVGQIPFTLCHLGWGAIFVTALTPMISRRIVNNPKLSWPLFRTACA